jgi:hypothetical protein
MSGVAGAAALVFDGGVAAGAVAVGVFAGGAVDGGAFGFAVGIRPSKMRRRIPGVSMDSGLTLISGSSASPWTE